MNIWKRLFGGSRPPSPPDTPSFHLKLITVEGKSALAELARLQRAGEEQGFWPVLLGDDEEISFHNELVETAEQDPEALILAAGKIDPGEFFRSRARSDPDYYQAEEGQAPETKLEPEGISAHLNVLSRRPIKWVHIGFVPTTNNYEIPAYLHYGGWNECPMPEEHVAIWKTWNGRFGANIISATHDVIEAEVALPPTTRETALELAREHFFYCPDIIHQGAGDLSTLASMLENGRTWYFWWD